MMKTKIINLKNYSKTFIAMNIYIILLIIMPKGLGTIFNIIPTRTILTFILFGIFLLDYKQRNIQMTDLKIKRLSIFYALFILSCLISLSATKNTVVSIYTIIKFISFYLVLIVFAKTKLTNKEYQMIIKNTFICSVIVCIYGIIQYIFEIDLNYNGVEKYKNIKGRIPSTFFNPIYFGAFINLIFLPTISFFKEKAINKFAFFIGLLLMATALLLTFTRSALLIFIFGGIVALVVLIKKVKIPLKSILLFVICLLVITVSIPGAKEMIQYTFSENSSLNSGDSNDASIEHRQEFNKIAIRIFSNNKLTGVGFGSYMDYMESNDFDESYPDYELSKTHPHTTVALMLAETGIISTILFGIFILEFAWIFTKKWISDIKNKDADSSKIFISLIVAGGFLLSSIIAENFLYDTQLFPLFIIIIFCLYNYDHKTKKQIKNN